MSAPVCRGRTQLKKLTARSSGGAFPRMGWQNNQAASCSVRAGNAQLRVWNSSFSGAGKWGIVRPFVYVESVFRAIDRLPAVGQVSQVLDARPAAPAEDLDPVTPVKGQHFFSPRGDVVRP